MCEHEFEYEIASAWIEANRIYFGESFFNLKNFFFHGVFNEFVVSKHRFCLKSRRILRIVFRMSSFVVSPLFTLFIIIFHNDDLRSIVCDTHFDVIKLPYGFIFITFQRNQQQQATSNNETEEEEQRKKRKTTNYRFAFCSVSAQTLLLSVAHIFWY